MNDEELKAGIDMRTTRISRQQNELDALKLQYRDSISRKWVAANNVTSASLCLSRGDDRPWFGSADVFWRWMQETGHSEPWAEWNGRIYPRDNLKTGLLRRDSPGLAEHVLP